MGNWRKNALQKLVFVLPTLNEEKALPLVLHEVRDSATSLAREGFSSEIIVVDGGSRDNTVEIAKSMGACVLHSPQGYGIQYQRAIEQCRGDIVITGDADFSYPFSEVPKLLKLFLDENLDFLTTNRFAGLQEESMTATHMIGNRVLTFLTNALFDLDIEDSQSGMWVFRRSFFDTLDVCDTGMSFSQAIKIAAFRTSKKVLEVPISYRARKGKAKLHTLRDGVDNFMQLLRRKSACKQSRHKGDAR
ncbi:MAG: glycosyltransferase family 2 protein [Nanoarchaeota archaeon]